MRSQEPAKAYVFPARGGFVAVYIALTLVVLIGFVALGLDMGRAYLARTELQIGADGGARAAAWLVPDDQDEAEDRALEAAAANTCLGDPISVVDVEFGRWNTFTGQLITQTDPPDPVIANLLSDFPPDAVRVTAFRTADRANPVQLFFAPVIGRESMDVVASAVARVTGGAVRSGIVGLESITLQGNSNTDSYKSAEGPYDPDNAGDNGDITSGGTLTLTGVSTVHGDAYYETTSSATAGVTVTGTTAQLPNPIDPEDYPPVDPENYSSDNANSTLDTQYFNPVTRDLVVSGGGTFTLGNGSTEYVKYYLNNVNLQANATLRISGKVEVAVTGFFRVRGAVENENPYPGDFRVRIAGSGDVTISGRSDVHADIYAPASDVTFNGLGNPKDPLGLFGSVIGKSLTLNGNSDIHRDESIDLGIETQVNVSLVR